MKILVANLGSTSLKYRLFEFEGETERTLARGGFERVSDYGAAIESCLHELAAGGFLESGRELAAVGFKTVLARGLTGCVEMDDQALAAMTDLAPVAPAHNPMNIAGIRKFRERLPGTPLIGLFETAFYQWVPEAARRYAVPEEWQRLGVQRNGFHGASHKYVAERSAAMLNREDVAARARRLYEDQGQTPTNQPDLRVISCHLGGSSSITGLKNGLAIGNSMGMSPQSGLPQNNRVGDLDAFGLLFVMDRLGLGIEEARKALSSAGGLIALSGGLNDMREIAARAKTGDRAAELAREVFIREVRRWIGAYYLELGGLEALVFTGGIGENDAELRALVCRDLSELGIMIEPGSGDRKIEGDAVISAPGSRVKVLVIKANEELVVARETKRYLDRREGKHRRPF